MKIRNKKNYYCRIAPFIATIAYRTYAKIHWALNYYAPTPNRWGIKPWCCLTSVWPLSVCLSRSSGLSREQRGLRSPRHTLLYDTTFKVKRSRSPSRFAHRRVGASGGCSGGLGNVLAVGNCCYVAVCSAAQGASVPTGEERGGAYCGGRPSTDCCLLKRVKQPIRAFRQVIHD